MLNDRLQQLSAREALRRSLLFPGVAASFLGLIFAAILVMVISVVPSNQQATFLGFRVVVKHFGLVVAVICAFLPPLVFIPQAYFDLRKRFVRCLECRQLRSRHEVERLRTIRRCSICQHELPNAKV